MRVLVVEDERLLASAIVRALSEDGHVVCWASDGQMGCEAADGGDFDALVLDVMMPKKDGWQVLEFIRSSKNTVPILMLSAMSDLPHRVKGLNLGADDYLPKPFETIELLARLNALLRRNAVHKGAVISIEDLVIDRPTRTVTRSGHLLALTRREYDLLDALASNQDRILSRETIQGQIWGNEDGLSNVVDVCVATLRKKVDAAFDRKLIHTAVGFGYVLRSRS